MRAHVFPAEPVYAAWREKNDPQAHPPVIDELTAEARKRDLWNLFMPDISGLNNVEYAQVTEVTEVTEVSGWSPVIAPEAINCQAGEGDGFMIAPPRPARPGLRGRRRQRRHPTRLLL